MDTNGLRKYYTIIITGVVIGIASVCLGSPSWMLIGVFILTAFFPITIRLIGPRFDPLEAGNIFPVIFALYSLSLPLKIVMNYSPEVEILLAQYICACLIGLLGFYFGYYNPLGKRLAARLPFFDHIQNRGMEIGALLLFLVLTPLLYRTITLAGGIQDFIGMGYGGERYLFFGREAYVGFWTDLFVVALLAYILAQVGRWRISKGIVILGLLILWTILNLFIGGRGILLRLFIGLAVAYHYQIKRISIGKVITGGILAYVVLVMYGHTRTLVVQVGLIETLKMMFNKLSIQALLPTSFGEFIAPAEALWELLEMKVSLSYQLGKSYFNTLLIMFPQTLFPGRPLTLGEWRMVTFYPSLFAAGEGKGFFTIAEGFINFGYIGILLHMSVYGLLARTVYEYCTQEPINKAKVLLYALTLPFIIIVGVRIDVAPVIKTYLFGYFLPTIAIFILAGRLYRHT